DLGHTPFGHAGQDAMDEVMQTFGSHFEHNEQSFRVLHELEEKSDEYRGINLSFEVLDGLLKHRTRYDHPACSDHLMPSLEAQIVNIADEIAYQSHDIDDGLRSGILTGEGLMDLDIWKYAAADKMPSNVPEIRKYQMVTSIISLLVNNLASNTNKKLQKLGINTTADIYAHDGQIAQFSDEVSQMAVQLKDYLYTHFYSAKEVMKYNDEGKKVITGLFRVLHEKPENLPEKYHAQLDQEERHIVVKDYIAGMTDIYAMDLYAKLAK
ncbi:MAG TPA: HD domain-containing protein, partial [Methylophaga sp.]|nr:HD domain-containing protein [Methylophaga sp.]